MAKRTKKKDPAAVALGAKGGKATAKARTAEERIEVARRAAVMRWRKEREKVQVK
jgi:hypothetical protein